MIGYMSTNSPRLGIDFTHQGVECADPPLLDFIQRANMAIINI